jgi:hypothetical protein
MSLPGHDMVGQDRRELLLVCQHSLQRVLWDLSERLVGRREHSEGTLPTQRLDQTSRLNGLNERVELASLYRNINDCRHSVNLLSDFARFSRA